MIAFIDNYLVPDHCGKQYQSTVRRVKYCVIDLAMLQIVSVILINALLTGRKQSRGSDRHTSVSSQNENLHYAH